MGKEDEGVKYWMSDAAYETFLDKKKISPNKNIRFSIHPKLNKDLTDSMTK